MKPKLILKTVFLIVVLLLLVVMGMNNPGAVSFKMPPLLSKPLNSPAAYMYFAFFAVGVLTGTVLTAKTKGGGPSRASKSER